MEKSLLKNEYLDEADNELTNLSLMKNYLEKTNRTDVEFSQFRRIDSLTLVDNGIKIPDLLIMKESKGKTDILQKKQQKYTGDEISELMQRTGLEKEDIIVLLQDGMQLEEIGKAADQLPFKEISESAAIRKMIRRDIDTNQLALLESKGIEVVAMKDGSLQVTNLEKLAEVDENGMVLLDPDFQKNLEPFEQMGLLSLSEGLVIKELEPEMQTQEMSTPTKGGNLKIVPLKEKREERTKEELEKEEIARQLGERPEDILSVIRIEDRDGGSKLFNDSLTQNAKPLIIRMRNNNFKVMEEKDDGTREEIQGFEATPVSKQVASLLKDTAHNHDTYIKAGEIKAGKTNPNEERYNLYQIRRAGESKDNDSNQLLFAGFSGNTDLSLIENKKNGNAIFDRVPQKSIYPSSVYMENNIGENQKAEIVKEDEETSGSSSPITYSDLSSKIEILEELMDVETEIREIEGQTGHDERCANHHYTHSHYESTNNDLSKSKNHDNSDPDISDAFTDDARKLPDLYARRNQLLQMLNLTLSDLLEEIEEEYYRGIRTKPY